MATVNLKLTFDPFHADITLLWVEEEPILHGDETGTFTPIRREQLNLHPQGKEEWPTFLGLLQQRYHSNCFQIDFCGPRMDLETLLHHYEAVRDKLGLQIDFLFCASPIESLNCYKYRRRRFRAINTEIQNGKHPALNDNELQDQFQTFVNEHLNRSLTAPTAADRAALDALLKKATECLESGERLCDELRNNEAFSRRILGYRNNRLQSQQEILDKLEAMDAAVNEAVSWEYLWEECIEELASMAAAPTASAASDCDGPDDWCVQFVSKWLDRFENCFGCFGKCCNDAVRALYRQNFWKRQLHLQETYPLFSEPVEGGVDPIWNPPKSEEETQMWHCYKEHAKTLLRKAYHQRLQLWEAEKQAFLACNADYIRHLREDMAITEKMLNHAQVGLQAASRKLDETCRQLLVARRTIEEAQFLLAESENQNAP